MRAEKCIQKEEFFLTPNYFVCSHTFLAASLMNSLCTDSHVKSIKITQSHKEKLQTLKIAEGYETRTMSCAPQIIRRKEGEEEKMRHVWECESRWLFAWMLEMANSLTKRKISYTIRTISSELTSSSTPPPSPLPPSPKKTAHTL